MKTKYGVETLEVDYCPCCGRLLESDGDILVCPEHGTSCIEGGHNGKKEKDRRHSRKVK